MIKKSEKTLLIIVLLAAVAMVLAYLPGPSGEKAAIPVSAATLPKLDDFTKQATQSVYALYNEEELTPLKYLTKDPFQPPMALVAETVQPAYELDIEVAGIFESRKGKFAIVNQKKVARGDVIDGIKIDRIENNGIYVSRMGKSFFVPMRKADFTKPKSKKETSDKQDE
jgi:hypothetical protein